MLAGLLLDEDGYVLVEQIQNEDHSADEEAVQRVVQKARHGVEMVDGVYRQRVKDEVNQRRDEQHGEGPVQWRAFPLGGEIHIRDQSQNQKQRYFHSQHFRHLVSMTNYGCRKIKPVNRMKCVYFIGI